MNTISSDLQKLIPNEGFLGGQLDHDAAKFALSEFVASC